MNPSSTPRKLLRIIASLSLAGIFLLQGCDLINVIIPEPVTSPTEVPATPAPSLNAEGLGLESFAQPTPALVAEITFRVQIPENSPADRSVYLVLRDEVTGLALNSESYPLQAEGVEGKTFYSLTLPFPMGSVIKYRYERQTETAPVAEHISNGEPVRYRVYHVEGPGSVEDVVSRWTDTEFISSAGRIMGQATDGDTGEPIPGLLVSAGGAQTLTTSDGQFLIEGLPPGVHNLTALAMDGSYRTFQQGALIAADSTTPTPIQLRKAPMINVAFVVRLPTDTPPIIPVRVAGSLTQFGNTFASLEGGINTLAVNMPVLTSLPDGRYLLKATVPAGADLRYKYTLGDGFWNAEHDAKGEFRLRQLVVPETDTLVVDAVDTWRDSSKGAITFDITVPANTPIDEYVSIQFNPLFGWTVPLPMWSLGNGRWAYILYSPINLPADLKYRYCRNGQCDRTDDVRTAGPDNPGFTVAIQDDPQTIADVVTGWAMLPEQPPTTTIITPTTSLETQNVVLGVEMEAFYHPSYHSLLPYTLGGLQAMNISWVVNTPTWTFTRQNPPVLEPVPGQDPTWAEASQAIGVSQGLKYGSVVFPSIHFPTSAQEWWSSASRDYAWWVTWFDHYRTFLLHHADLANLSGAQALVLGGDWLTPALPGGVLADGSPSGVPAEAEERWRGLIAEVRAHFGGQVLWALDRQQSAQAPAFLTEVDGLFLIFWAPLAVEDDSSTGEAVSTEVDPAAVQARIDAMAVIAGQILDAEVLPLQSSFNKPVYLALSYPSTEGALTGCAPTINGDCIPPQEITTSHPELFNLSLNLQEQLDAYSAILTAVTSRPWINGVITRGYYAPARLMDPSLSAHGKPLENLLKGWFGIPAP